MSSTSFDLPDALANVRRAYRLLHAYHRRLCDLLQLVHESVGKAGLEFESWEPLNVARLPRSATPFFENWAWDLTPAYQVRCVWRDGHQDKTKEKLVRRVVIDAFADSGWDWVQP
jgi:hypothetical protein